MDDLPEGLRESLDRMNERIDEARLEAKRVLVGPPPNSWFEPERLWVEGGVHCAVLRQELGHLCGYALVEESHPWWGLDYGDEVPMPVTPDLNQPAEQFIDDHGVMAVVHLMAEGDAYTSTLGAQVQVHGGLTFAGPLAIEGAPWGWWIGFDCAHSGDTVDPAYCRGSEIARGFRTQEIVEGAHIWTVEEVAMETSRMVSAISLAAGAGV